MQFDRIPVTCDQNPELVDKIAITDISQKSLFYYLEVSFLERCSIV